MAPKSSSGETRVTAVRIIETHFVETDVANFKSVVQSFTAQESNARPQRTEAQNSAFVNIMPPPSNPNPNSNYTPAIIDLLQVSFADAEVKQRKDELDMARDDVTVADAQEEEMVVFDESRCMGLETENSNSIAGDYFFETINDAFELPPWSIHDMEIHWDSSLWPDDDRDIHM